MKLYLGSQSPRRKELLAFLGYVFEVVHIDCEEVYPKEIPANKIAGYLSRLKAEAFGRVEKNQVLITADTIVAMDNEILGKPKNEGEARAMLRLISGKTHQVYTAISVKTDKETITRTDVAEVEMEQIDEEEINFYIDKYKPFDKAGAYGIQEWLGMAKISKINGSFYTIMGLPTAIIYNLLRKIGL